MRGAFASALACDFLRLRSLGPRRVLVDEYVRVLKEKFNNGDIPNLEKICMALRHRKGSNQ